MDNNLVGQTIQGRYHVVKQLGRGGVGVTFIAQDQQCFNSQCVVKQLKPKSANPKTLEIARRLFNREAQIMNRLGDCDRIPRLLAYFEAQNDFFLVQELIEGHDLSTEIIAGQPWSEEKTVALVRDILEVLMMVQQHSVIHRDLKPSNLMRRDQDNKIILIDFGSVKQVSTQIIDAAGNVKPTVAVGTKSYMPIEQMMGHPGFYSDIYAVGIIAIQALTGVTPKEFPIDQKGEIIWRNKLDSQVHYQPRFLDILAKMVRYRYQERYTSAGMVLSDLQQLDAEQNNSKQTILIAKPTPTADQVSLSPKTSDLADETKITVNQLTPPIEQNQSEAVKGDRTTQTLAKKPKSLLIPGILSILTLMAAAVGGWSLLRDKNAEPETKLSHHEHLASDFKINQVLAKRFSPKVTLHKNYSAKQK